jgi:acyl-coenzyme A synthetase/AMP-(fatty) acid ligase
MAHDAGTAGDGEVLATHRPVRKVDSAFAKRLSYLVAEFADYSAFLFEGDRVDWGTVGRIRRAVEVSLAGAGIGLDAPVGVIFRERPSTCAALLAVLSSNRCAVLLSAHLPDDALRDDLERLRLPALVADRRDWERHGLVSFVAGLDTLGIEVCDHGVVRIHTEVRPIGPSGYQPEPGTAIAVLTSGTTGPPKRIPLSFRSLDEARSRVTVKDPPSAQGVTINVLPLTTIGGVRGIAEAVWRGRALALMERFDVWKWAALVREYHPRRVGIPPAVLRTLLDERVPPEWFTGVEALTTGAAPLHVPTVRAFFDVYRLPVLNAYGSTEFGGRVAEWKLTDWAEWHETKLGSVGRPMSHVAVRIVGDDGTERPIDKIGLLEVRFVADAGSGWIRTNDLARLDTDGFLWMEGRADDVIIRGGFKVAASEVEAVLDQHPDVLEAIVVGLDDERLGQVPAAAITLRDGAPTVSETDLIEWMRARLVPYKVPRIVRVVDAIPRNDMFKPLRREVKLMLGPNGATRSL